MGQSPSTAHHPSPLASLAPPPPYTAVERPITAGDVQPMDMDGRRALALAVAQMQECKAVFTSWRRAMDESLSHDRSELEREVCSCIVELEENSTATLGESKSIIEAHRSLGVLMSRRFSNTNSSIILQPSTEIISLIEEIQRRSETVNDCANAMKAKLCDLVSMLETGEPRRRKKTFFQSLFGWVKKVLFVVSAVLGALAAACKFVYPAAVPALELSSMLSGATATFASACEAGSATSSEQLLAMLRETIPAQADQVAQRLSDFQYCNLLLQREMEMQKGVVYRLDRQEAEHARLRWEIHNIAMENLCLNNS
ncbi:hypothetical protein PHLGIDRAFT_418251 [Phlebiopsis gigantea 11061_1 CR5-6]|uniref:Uncharacterized protein n=1 Tax=Phlebiopsis gigantea (strain 11061_1 CR5-6) TaxID=745531 RepID=A0A0C3SDJ4_PHLG1|nr:hypothetical protein PHLGIDRAFT_418251 [Phlebiopsis gigantea 11061_1 CR5-6]